MRIDRSRSAPAKLRATPSRVPTDPRVKVDDPCVVCGGERPSIGVANEDPFCTTLCCRAWYLVER